MRYAYVGCRTTKERNARGEGLKLMKSSQMAAGNACSVWKQSQTRLFRLWMAKENIFTVFMGILRRFPVTVF
jgi:SPX domain protein involved in polyphosphate accumulation